LREKIQADYVDREIHRKSSPATSSGRAGSHRPKEILPGSLLGRIAEALAISYGFDDGFDGAYLRLSEMPLDDARYLQALTSVVRDLARSQRLVILGRGVSSSLKILSESFTF